MSAVAAAEPRFKPFLLLATRAEDDAANAEYEAIRMFAALRPSELARVRLERAPLGDVRLSDYSGVLIGGGPFNASDAPASKSVEQRRAESEIAALLDQVVSADFPFLGLCYGVGTLGKKIGATVNRDFGEEVGPVEIQLTEAGRDDPLLADVPEAFMALAGHKEAIAQLPADAVLLASSAPTPVQMFRVGANVYATQFHPELDVAGVIQRIHIYRDCGYFDPAEFDAVIARAESEAIEHPGRILENFARRYAAPLEHSAATHAN